MEEIFKYKMGKGMVGVRKSRIQDVAQPLISCVNLGQLLSTLITCSGLLGQS